MLKLTTILFLALLLAAEAAAASRLLNYESRVVRAAEQIERIKIDREYSDDGVGSIKRLLPRTETVEFDGEEVSVDNSWLYTLLDSYVSENDPQQRVAYLNEAVGRLRSLDEHLRRAAAAGNNEAAGPRDQIREILSRRAFQPEQETVVGTFMKKVLRAVRSFIGEVYSALTRLLERMLGTGASVRWIPNILLIAVLAVALVLVWKLGKRIRRPQTRRKKTRLVLGEEIAADSTARELADAGLAAARAGDFRTAVRKLYVSLLYELAERSLIELEDNATNHEYLSKASRFTALAGPMGYLTDRFDYVWYGMFPSSEDDFAAYLAGYIEAMEHARTLGEQTASAS